ncbi:hypothetical protein NL676_032941 [Syzygium grande]|nr:hypothetical protein NL676_032941 [Syzygium grande]
MAAMVPKQPHAPRKEERDRAWLTVAVEADGWRPRHHGEPSSPASGKVPLAGDRSSSSPRSGRRLYRRATRLGGASWCLGRHRWMIPGLVTAGERGPIRLPGPLRPSRLGVHGEK